MAFFVQQALQNTTNAFLAFVGNQTRDFPSYQDFAARQQLYTSTLQLVASANAGLKNFFLTINEFADQTEVERNVVNGVKGMRKVRGRVGGWASERASERASGRVAFERVHSLGHCDEWSQRH